MLAKRIHNGVSAIAVIAVTAARESKNFFIMIVLNFGFYPANLQKKPLQPPFLAEKR
jgi:hypothetical protein